MLKYFRLKRKQDNPLGPDVDFDGNGWETEIDISCNVQSEKLFARKIWEALYPVYLYFGSKNEFDSFLCDLDSWSNIIKNEWKKGHDFVRFYWHVNGVYTNNSMYDYFNRSDDVFEIIVDTQKIGDKKIIIKKKYCQIVP